MSARLLEGRTIAEKVRQKIETDLASLVPQVGRPPKLVALQVGEDQASALYAKSQARIAEAIGIDYELKVLPEEANDRKMAQIIADINADDLVDAVILQLPVPKTLDAKRVLSLIDPGKDAEGMHPVNLGKVLLGAWDVAPCTASACLALIESTGVDLFGKETVIVGHSEIVGKPLSLMLLSRFATTTVCHIATGERGLIGEHVRRAELLVVAVGRPGLVKGAWIKEGAIVIDVGINSVNGKVVGDVEFDAAEARASFITPVPGGVGPLTVTMLMKNVAGLYRARWCASSGTGEACR